MGGFSDTKSHVASLPIEDKSILVRGAGGFDNSQKFRLAGPEGDRAEQARWFAGCERQYCGGAVTSP